MNIYNEYFLPHFINCACGLKAIERQRAKMLPLAKGKVLEVGMGSALNLRHYNAGQVDMIWGLEPSSGMRRKAQVNLEQSPIEVQWLALSSQSIPLEDNCADTIVLTYTLCTIDDWLAALKEMKRVLKPDGQLVFSEHGEAPEERVRKWQKRVNPIWKVLAGGCNLNRQIPSIIEAAGFNIKQLDQHYIKGPKLATYQYYGVANI